MNLRMVFGTQLVKFRVEKCQASRRSAADLKHSAELPLTTAFNKIWPALQEQGWTFKKGRGLVSWMYLRPGVKDDKGLFVIWMRCVRFA